MEVYDWLWIWKTPRTRPEIVKKDLYEGRLETLFRICSSFEMLSQKVAVIHCGPHQFHQIHHHQRLQQHHHRRRDAGVVVINTLIIIAFFYHYYCCQDSVNWCPTHAIETGRDRGGDEVCSLEALQVLEAGRAWPGLAGQLTSIEPGNEIRLRPRHSSRTRERPMANIKNERQRK